jgi:hypothetical protein
MMFWTVRARCVRNGLGCECYAKIMPRVRRVPIPTLLVGIAVAVGGCPPIAPGSRAYRPAEAEDAAIFARARRDVFPDDDRSATAGAGLVAWAGLEVGFNAYMTKPIRLEELCRW